MRLDGDAWAAKFRDFGREAFRLETLPEYRVPQERATFAAFLAGEQPPTPESSDPWAVTIASALERGARMRRVHVLTSPLSDYLRFEMAWYYQASVAAGEEIRILDLATTPDPGLPAMDYWLFDERDVVHMMYQPDGTQIGRELLEDADPAQFCQWRDLAWEAAVPFTAYAPDATRA